MSEKETGKRTSHEACVRTVAEELKRANWNVKAKLEGFEKPQDVANGYVPDIQAEKKGCMTKICEVATPEMFEGNLKKYIEFKQYCNNYDFQMFVVDKEGKRRKVDPETFGKNRSKQNIKPNKRF